MLRMTKEQFDDAVAVLQKSGHPGDDENVRRVCVAAVMIIRQRRGLDPETTWQPTDVELIEFLSELNDPANLSKRKSLKRIAESPSSLAWRLLPLTSESQIDEPCTDNAERDAKLAQGSG
jgi:hypothetical protein